MTAGARCDYACGSWERPVDDLIEDIDVDLYELADPHPNAEEILIAAACFRDMTWPNRAERRAAIAEAALERHAQNLERDRLWAIRIAEWHRHWIHGITP